MSTKRTFLNSKTISGSQPKPPFATPNTTRDNRVPTSEIIAATYDTGMRYENGTPSTLTQIWGNAHENIINARPSDRYVNRSHGGTGDRAALRVRTCSRSTTFRDGFGEKRAKTVAEMPTRASWKPSRTPRVTLRTRGRALPDRGCRILDRIFFLIG